MQVTRQLVAELCLFGMGFDALGGCYLAYDLFGRSLGAFRTIARAASYFALFFAGYGLVLGVDYALIAAMGMGTILAIEYWWAEKKTEKPKPKWAVSSFGMLRGVVLGLAALPINPLFGFCFGLLSGLFLTLTYAVGFAPMNDYAQLSRPSVNSHKLTASLLRMAGVGISGVIAGIISHDHDHSPWKFGLRLGVAAGLVSAVVGLFSPWIEWQVDRLKDRRMGLLGLVFILIGMALQSVQYWVVVLNITVS